MNDLLHYMPLYAGYATALALLAVAVWRFPALKPVDDEEPLKLAWLQLLGVIVAGAGVVAIGMWIYNTDPAGELGRWRIPAEIGLELVRFSPLVLFLLVFRPRRSSVWVGTNPAYFGVGVVLAAAALLVFSAVSVRSPVGVVSGMASGLAERDLNVAPLIVHVFFEDLIIVLLGSRLLAVCKRLWIAALVTAALFALAHVPALIDDGVEVAEIGSLFLDTGLGVCVFIALARTRDMLWFWPVHVVLDFTQFSG